MAEAKVPDQVAHDPYKQLLYIKAIRKGKERENTLRINIVGNYSQGKTSLANRLIGRSCGGVTTTNGIEVNRYKCPISGDGNFTLKALENKSQEFGIRIATVARSKEITKTLERQETNLEECDRSEQKITRHEISQPPKQRIETLFSCSKAENVLSRVEPLPNSARDTSSKEAVQDIVKHSSMQIPEARKKKRMAMSSEELVTFSETIEKQKHTPPKFIDIWDFGGQYIYHATHTLFHSSTALYLLVFDLTKPLDIIVRDEEFPGETEDRNMEYFARFWLESINAYVGSGPQVILVGTHKDKLEGYDPSGKEYFEKVRCLFDNTELLTHIQKEQFAVDNYAISDPGISDLLELISKKHEELAEPIEVPARWIPLEKALREWQASKIISLQDVIELDKENKYPLQDEEQIKLFLHYHHEKGTFFFYDEGSFVCLDPKYLIDAFKCIITSEHFYKNDPEIRPLWQTLSKEGRLSHRLIDKVWSNSGPDFMKHKDALLGFLKKQNIIAEVVEYNAKSKEKKQQDWFIVPSLLKNHSSNEEMNCFLNLKKQSQVRFSMKFDKPSSVHMIYTKILAAALGIMPVVNCRDKQLLFENVCILKLRRNHAGILEKRTDSGTIELRVVNLLPKSVESHCAGEFRRFVESVVLNEFRRVNYHKGGKDKMFSSAYRCNHADHGPNGGSRLTYFEEDEDVFCPDNVTHESFDYKRAKEEWFSENTIGEVFPNMQLTEKTLSKLAQSAIGENWHLLGPELYINRAEIDHIVEQHKSIEMQIYKMLLKWKDRSTDKATLDMLVEAIKKCPGVSIYWDEIKNIRDKYLREQKKQSTDLIHPLSNKTVQVNQTLTLECEITSSNVLFTWFKGDEPITQDGRKRISSNKGLHQLAIKDVKKEDTGKYALQFGESKTECIVKIVDPYGNLKFVKELIDIEVRDTNIPVTFTCELNTSEAQVEWYYRNQLLHQSNKYTITVDGSVHMLTIKNVSERDEGKYMVLANGDMSEAELYIEETEEERYLVEQLKNIREDPYRNLKFVKELIDIEIGVTNIPVTFTCELNTSLAQVEWYYRNQLLYPSNKYTITVDGSVHMLTIKNVSEQDKGKYMVLAKGLMSEAKLYIKGMGASSSTPNWAGQVSYYPEVDKNSNCMIATSRTLLNEKELMEDSRESILDVYSYKVPLINITGTCLWFYHRFVVFKTNSWWWSIEKNGKEIIIQRSENETAVRDRILGEKRSNGANITLEKKDSSNVNVKALLEMLDYANETLNKYHLLESNCQVIGKRIFEYIRIKSMTGKKV